MKIAVAMSGGVDSSVAAALMVEKYGAEAVFGVTMKLFCYGDAGGSDKSCCSLDAIADAAAVCKQLGIRHYVINLEKEFQAEVIDDFVASYAAGLTPNPCVRCNQTIKYEHLLRKAQELGAEKLVTGHYARIVHDELGFHLLRGLDEKKDQSYFLYNITKQQLAHLEFPIGELTKPETRELARKYKLRTAEKTESQDICFVTTDVNGFLHGKIEDSPGDIVDSAGKVWGRHNGLHHYTIGQRKGLGGGFPSIMYVVGLDTVNNQVIIGSEQELFGSTLVVAEPHWISAEPELPYECTAKIRYASEDVACVISRIEKNSNIIVTFKQPQKAITPGQSAVLYDKEVVLGGGVILSTGKL